MSLHHSFFSSIQYISIRVRHSAETRWSPYIKGQWMARMPANHACCIITWAEEMKWNEMIWDECGEMVERNLWYEKTGETPRKPTQTPFRPPQNPHDVTEMWNWGPSDGRWESNRLCHGATFFHYNWDISNFSQLCIFEASTHFIGVLLPSFKFS